MNILYHHRTQGQGAEGNHIREVFHALKRLGHRLDMISPPGVDPLREAIGVEPKAKPSFIKNTLKTAARHWPQACFEAMELGYNFYASWQLYAYLKQHSADMIYERYAFFCKAPSLISKKFGIPHILEVNEISGIKRQRAQAMTGLCNRCEMEIFRNASAIIVVSDFLKNEIVARGIDAEKIFVMPNAINPGDFDPDADVRGLRNEMNLQGKSVITFVGMFSGWDRLEFLLDSFAAVRRAVPAAHLVIVGDGKERATLMEQAKEKGVADGVTFTGKVPRAAVSRYIALADLCVLSGSNPFGSPMALFEYMAMGKPVVVPDYTPITAIVDHGVEGYVFPPDNGKLFIDHIVELLRNNEKRQAMSAAASKKIAGHFTWENNAKKIIQIYEKVKNVPC